MKKTVIVILLLVMWLPRLVSAQAIETADAWRTLAAKLEPGSDLNVRLHNGQRFRATLIDARQDAVVLQPRTRVPVPPQAVAYTDLASVEPRKAGGMSAGKAAAIGVATGTGAFFAILAILLATVSD